MGGITRDNYVVEVIWSESAVGSTILFCVVIYDDNCLVYMCEELSRAIAYQRTEVTYSANFLL